jgi:hypothetical protein
MSRRREDFPSWSWAEWRGCSEVKLQFINTTKSSLEPRWYCNRMGEEGQYVLSPVSSDDRHLVKSTKGSPDPYSTYCLPAHPVGSLNDERREKVVFEHNKNVMPPISQILHFWTSVAFLSIGSDPTKKRRVESHVIREPANHTEIGRIELDMKWRDRHQGLGEFIVISESYLPASDDPDYERRHAHLSVMLIERRPESRDLAFRVQLCNRYIPLDVWREAKPEFKLINLASGEL